MANVPTTTGVEPRRDPFAGATVPDHGPYASHEAVDSFGLVTRSGREMLVRLAAQPVFDLQRRVIVGHRIRREVRHVGDRSAFSMLGRRALEAADLKRIDVEALRHSLPLLRPDRNQVGMAPVFWRTVSSAAGRLALALPEDAGQDSGHRLVLEVIGGLETQRPEGLAEMLEAFGEAGRTVFLHAAPDVDLVRRLGRLEPNGLTLDLAGVDHTGARGWERARRLIAAAREAAPKVMLLTLRPDLGEAARAAGATHAVFGAMREVVV